MQLTSLHTKKHCMEEGFKKKAPEGLKVLL